MTLCLAGCATQFNTATNRQETLLYGDDKERSIGASVAAQVEKEFTFLPDVDVNERVEGILKRIAAVCDRKDIIYTIHVVDEDEVNAFSLPGGYVYLYKGLIDRVSDDDELAGVIAHEVAHVTAKHSMKRLQGSYGALVLTGAAIATGEGALAAGADLSATSLLLRNSREDEFEADRLAVKYMKLAGFNPIKMSAMLGKLLEYQAKLPPRPRSYWRTHPFIPQRMAQAEAEAQGHVNFRQYLNITGEER